MTKHLGEPVGVPIGDLRLYGGPSRSRAFKLVKEGKLQAYRVGRARLVTMDSLRQLIGDALAAEGRS